MLNDKFNKFGLWPIVHESKLLSSIPTGCLHKAMINWKVGGGVAPSAVKSAVQNYLNLWELVSLDMFTGSLEIYLVRNVLNVSCNILNSFQVFMLKLFHCSAASLGQDFFRSISVK